MSQRQRLDAAAEHNHGEIEAAVTAFEDRSVVYDPADIARAGVFVSIDSEGWFSGDRGLCPTGG
jgi:ParB family chromosome partitioning protein